MNSVPRPTSLPSHSIPPPPLFTRNAAGGVDLLNEVANARSSSSPRPTGSAGIARVDALTSLESTLESLANLLFALRQERRRIQHEKQQLNVEWAKFRRMCAGSYMRMYEASMQQQQQHSTASASQGRSTTCERAPGPPSTPHESVREAMRRHPATTSTMEAPSWTATLDKMTANCGDEMPNNLHSAWPYASKHAANPRSQDIGRRLRRPFPDEDVDDHRQAKLARLEGRPGNRDHYSSFPKHEGEEVDVGMLMSSSKSRTPPSPPPSDHPRVKGITWVGGKRVLPHRRPSVTQQVILRNLPRWKMVFERKLLTDNCLMREQMCVTLDNNADLYGAQLN
ncbi:hypothetical protein Pmar_PMAR014105 [Perkinsus marinus ATCC 50983]|uniref:Uncharacterized protein n=1 Tax=Perkinsus marinus (strain ATCC 50983 / TXsc) TaxID=423536 RepID=C5L2W6_PERM5|nr:hypothetical protein Pmar_PMAR014105 [Perkinsus marinus ATCC 50983]EER08939.1 hypothetical protein Pmar_PMAR014105 [Perkinsus marinus ATCC 50983]|eukprot:XP_002777123.1 hypothetical protein Pmar_PMAR014105 [Perkinsus marinus ATCC 50983]